LTPQPAFALRATAGKLLNSHVRSLKLAVRLEQWAHDSVVTVGTLARLDTDS